MSLPFRVDALKFRVLEVPALDDDAPPSAVWSRMLPGLAMAHAAGHAVACSWIRVEPNSRVGVFAGVSDRPGPGPEAGPVPFPAGARGVARSSAQITQALESLPSWHRAEVALDTEADGAVPTPSVEDVYALLAEQAMGFVVIAQPRSRSQTDGHLGQLSDAIDALEAMRSGRGSERIRRALVEGELAYLERWSPRGLWEIEVWTGGQTDGDARAVAALLGAGSDESAPPLRVRAAEAPRARGANAGDDQTGIAWSGSRLVGPDAVAWLARPPGRELSGVRVVEVPDFDLTPEIVADVRLGRVLDATRAASLVFGVPRSSLNRHVFVTGATGSGKSQTTRALLEALTLNDVPWLVIEPAKAEYAGMAGRLAASGTKVSVIRPGDPAAPPASLNPLEPSSITVGGVVHRFPLQTHLDLVRALFTAAFDAQEPFPQILAAALTRSYEQLGWNLAVGRAVDGRPEAEPRWPTLSDLQAEAMAAVAAIGYAKDIADNVRGFVKVRIDSLRLGTPGRFFEGGHPIDLERVLAENVVFEIEDLGDDNDKAFFIGTVLIRLFEVLRLREQHGVLAPGLNHMTVVEEAHRLLRQVEEGTPAAQAVTMFANLLAEVRAYGEGIIVAEQIPSKVIADVVKNSAVKIVHRLPADEDRAFVGGTMNLTESQSRQVVSLGVGEAVAHVDGMDEPVLVKIDARGRSRERRVPGAVLPISSRSSSCSSACQTIPCTLDQMVVSRTFPIRAQLRLWAELVALAHLLGEPLPALEPSFRAELLGLPRDRLRCAIGLFVDEAVDRRSAFIRQCYDPALLSGRTIKTMGAQLKVPTAPGQLGPEWQFADFRWADVLRALKKPPATADTARPHPETGAWAARGLALRGQTYADQLVEVRRATARLQAPVLDSLGGRPMVLDELAGEIVGGVSGVERFGRAAATIGFTAPWTTYWVEPCFEGQQ